MSEVPVAVPPFVALADLATFLKASEYETGPERHLLQVVLNAALTDVEERIERPLDNTPRTFVVRTGAPYRVLVLPVTSLVEVTSITGPDGVEIPLDLVDDIDLEAGIIILPAAQRGRYTVVATDRLLGDSLRLAVMIIASHLWQVQRGSDSGTQRVGFGMPVADTAPIPRGFAIPARALELVAPFVPGGGFA